MKLIEQLENQRQILIKEGNLEIDYLIPKTSFGHTLTGSYIQKEARGWKGKYEYVIQRRIKYKNKIWLAHIYPQKGMSDRRSSSQIGTKLEICEWVRNRFRNVPLLIVPEILLAVKF